MSVWREIWPYAIALGIGVTALVTAGHAMLHKRDVRAATGWVGLILLAPVVGIALYLLLGINRIRRRATRLQRSDRPPTEVGDVAAALTASLGEHHRHLAPLARLTEQVTRQPLTLGNGLQPLENGDEAYPAMLEAIGSARRSVALCSYIFDNDAAGQRFVDALVAAHRRGVAVRVLIDAVGARYSWPRTILGSLKREGVPCARFLPTLLPWRMPYANLRNHRKLLVVDGERAFTGGMNIRAGHESGSASAPSILDTHFSVTGPVVGQLQQAFCEDWKFATREVLEGEPWLPELSAAGDVLARGILDGPDEDRDRLLWAYRGALDCAQQRVLIVTPYFLPDRSLIAALSSAALRGVQVDIVLPHQSNLSLVQWAMTATLWQVLEHGCRVWLTPPPFDHSKLMVVDSMWSFVGSGNWDPRSLRLSFEFNVECYGAELSKQLEAMGAAKLERATRLTLADVDGRALPIKLRDGVARLFTPFL